MTANRSNSASMLNIHVISSMLLDKRSKTNGAVVISVFSLLYIKLKEKCFLKYNLYFEGFHVGVIRIVVKVSISNSRNLTDFFVGGERVEIIL